MLKLQVLGCPELHDPSGQSIQSVLAQPKRLALLVHLALNGGFARRDSLLALFWPELDQEHARASLRQAVHYLRRSLGAQLIVGRGDEEIGIGEGRLWCDAVEFRRALRSGEPEAALELYRDDLLPGFFLADVPEFERWLDTEREALRQEAARTAQALAQAAEATGDLARAVHWSRRQLALARGDEVTLRRLLVELHRMGDRTGALRAYEEFCKELQEAYDLEPSAETRALVASIRTPPEEAEPAEAVVAPDAGVAAATVAVVVEPPEVANPVGTRVVAAPRPAPRAEGWRRRVAASLLARRLRLVALVGVLGLATLSATRVLRGTAAESTAASIAVLPIVDISPGRSAEYLGDGTTEELINRLGKVPGLWVSSRTSSYAFKGAEEDVREIGRKLGVRHVVEGSVRRNADRLRFSIRLINVEDGRQIWSGTYDRRLEDVLRVQAEIGQSVVEALQGQLGLRAPEAAPPTTSSAAAYDAYLRGRFLMHDRSREPLEAAVRYFTAAAGDDPRYSLAYAGLAEAYVALAEWVSPESVLPKARTAAEQALRLNDKLPETHLALARVLLQYEWDWPGAERQYRRALELAPRLPAAHYGYANYLRAARRFDEMLRETERGLALERATAVDTLAFTIQEHTRLSGAYYQAHRYDEAVRHAHEALELDPNAFRARITLAQSLYISGHAEQAVASLEPVRRQFGERSEYLFTLAAAYARAGRRDEALGIRERLLERSRSEYVPKTHLALIDLALGDRDGALRWLEASAAERHWWTVYQNSYPELEPLRTDARFRRLLQSMRAPS